MSLSDILIKNKKTKPKFKIENGFVITENGVKLKLGDVSVKNSGEVYIFDKPSSSTDIEFYEPDELFYDDLDYVYKLYKYTRRIDIILNFEKNGNAVLGYSSESAVELLALDTITYKDHKVYYCDKKTLEDCKFIRINPITGTYFHIKGNLANTFLNNDNSFKQTKIKEKYDYSLGAGLMGHVKGVYEKYNVIDESVKNEYDFSLIESLINKYSYGFEFETVLGTIPNAEAFKHGLIPLRDGSISGLEYATIPLSGKSDFLSLIQSLKLLKKRTLFDDSCSLHLHIGNVPRTESFILAFYKLLFNIQEEYFEMFPVHKQFNLGIKRKSYSAPFPVSNLLTQLDKCINESNIRTNFDVLHSWLTETPTGNYPGLNSIKAHPRDPNNDRKWEIHTRYYFINLIPLIFGNKQTIEFRIHKPTYDETSILYFALLNTMLIEFTIKHEKVILSNLLNDNHYNLAHIIESTSKYNELTSALLDYANKRRRQRDIHFKEGNFIGNEKTLKFKNIFKIKSKDPVKFSNSYDDEYDQTEWSNDDPITKVLNLVSKQLETRNYDNLNKELDKIRHALMIESDSPAFLSYLVRNYDIFTGYVLHQACNDYYNRMNKVRKYFNSPKKKESLSQVASDAIHTEGQSIDIIELKNVNVVDIKYDEMPWVSEISIPTRRENRKKNTSLNQNKVVSEKSIHPNIIKDEVSDNRDGSVTSALKKEEFYLNDTELNDVLNKMYAGMPSSYKIYTGREGYEHFKKVEKEALESLKDKIKNNDD